MESSWSERDRKPMFCHHDIKFRKVYFTISSFIPDMDQQIQPPLLADQLAQQVLEEIWNGDENVPPPIACGNMRNRLMVAEALHKVNRVTDEELGQEHQCLAMMQFKINNQGVSQQLREMQASLNQMIRRFDQRFDTMGLRIDRRFDAVNQRFDAVDQELRNIREELDVQEVVQAQLEESLGHLRQMEQRDALHTKLLQEIIHFLRQMGENGDE
jgi:hypothetical protein